jgi:hypothetical protein
MTTSFVTLEPRGHYDPADPLLSLANHCILSALGEQVQRVTEAMEGGEQPHSWPQIVQQLRRRASVAKAVVTTRPTSAAQRKIVRQRDAAFLRAALVVLWQHSLVTIRPATALPGMGKTAASRPLYTYHPHKAVYVGGPRYARCLEYVRKALDPTAAAVVETLLLHGKARTVDLIRMTIQEQSSLSVATAEGNSAATGATADRVASSSDVLPAVHSADSVAAATPDSSMAKHDRLTPRERVVQALVKLVQGGYLEALSPMPSLVRNATAPPVTVVESSDEEAEFDNPPRKKKKVTIAVPVPSSKASPSTTTTRAAHEAVAEDPALQTILDGNALFKALLPPTTVWRVRLDMLHASLRAVALGRLVNEVHGHRVQSAGSFVSAALRYKAAVEYGAAGATVGGTEGGLVFQVAEITKFLPKPVYQTLDAKPGGVEHNLKKALLELVKCSAPQVVQRAGRDMFEVCQTPLMTFWKARVVHQIISDRHGQSAARIVTILLERGWLEADTLAEFAMVPVKDMRAMLHTLYQSGYVELFPLYTSSSARQHNPNNAIFLWKVDRAQLLRIVTEQVALATWNLRVRRQHQVEDCGKSFMERASQSTDENENADDRRNYQKFELGLERIDVALQQLDETLMVLQDF